MPIIQYDNIYKVLIKYILNIFNCNKTVLILHYFITYQKIPFNVRSFIKYTNIGEDFDKSLDYKSE